MSRIKFCTFTGRPDALLIHAPAGHDGPLRLPALGVPFTRGAVADACRAAGIDATVIESVPGRWTRALLDARSATGEQKRREQALQTQAMKGAVNPEERDRAKLVERLQAIPTEQRKTKAAIHDASRRVAGGGAYMPRAEWIALLDLEAALKEETIAIQAQLARIKERKKVAARDESSYFERRFFDAAKEFLDEETIDSLTEAASEDEEVA